jgi:hypothetical protein
VGLRRGSSAPIAALYVCFCPPHITLAQRSTSEFSRAIRIVICSLTDRTPGFQHFPIKGFGFLPVAPSRVQPILPTDGRRALDCSTEKATLKISGNCMLVNSGCDDCNSGRNLSRVSSPGSGDPDHS